MPVGVGVGVAVGVGVGVEVGANVGVEVGVDRSVGVANQVAVWVDRRGFEPRKVAWRPSTMPRPTSRSIDRLAGSPKRNELEAKKVLNMAR
jgi:hypothetical protein